jgi:hypothetical protein
MDWFSAEAELEKMKDGKHIRESVRKIL